ncbi:MAG: tetratricopeptide repeat protein [Chitinophagales bacterium]|nr:tetratricopeptide repeat protein [Chitinophagales bacterium]
MKKLLVIAICFCVYFPFSYAGKFERLIDKGNTLYKKKKYKEATAKYYDAIQKNPFSGVAFFNHGAALYKSKKYKEAQIDFEQSLKLLKDKRLQAKAYHNLGNSFYHQKKYDKAASAYMQSLKINPTDEATRYNLVYVMKKLQQEMQQQQQNQPQPKPKENKQQDKKNQPQQPNQPLTKEQIERMLKNIKNEEKTVQQKLDKLKSGQPGGLPDGKDW